MVVQYVLTAAGIIFWIGAVPLLAVFLSVTITGAVFDIPGMPSLLCGAFLSLAGLLLSLWAVAIQITAGKGTPIPMYAPRKLIVTGPYRCCRNPMTLGLVLYYTGAGMILNDMLVLVILWLVTIAHSLYDYLYEEKELEMRFGDSYREYKNNTPFILPNIYRSRS